jgi:hypothetical protein
MWMSELTGEAERYAGERHGPNDATSGAGGYGDVRRGGAQVCVHNCHLRSCSFLIIVFFWDRQVLKADLKDHLCFLRPPLRSIGRSTVGSRNEFAMGTNPYSSKVTLEGCRI